MAYELLVSFLVNLSNEILHKQCADANEYSRNPGQSARIFADAKLASAVLILTGCEHLLHATRAATADPGYLHRSGAAGLLHHIQSYTASCVILCVSTMTSGEQMYNEALWPADERILQSVSIALSAQLRFERPNAVLRGQLWKTMLSSDLSLSFNPKSDGKDKSRSFAEYCDQLARKYPSFTGGTIKSCVLRAMSRSMVRHKKMQREAAQEQENATENVMQILRGDVQSACQMEVALRKELESKLSQAANNMLL